MSKQCGLVCYTISDSSDFEDDEEQVTSPETVANYVINGILREVCHGLRDFSDMYIKQEPEDDDVEIWDASGQDYRDLGTSVKIESEESESDSDDDDVSSSSSSAEESIAEAGKKPDVDIPEETEGSNLHPPRTKNELLIRDLPPVEELHITVPAAEVLKIGTVSSCVEELVVVESLPGNPAIDLDSVLFLDAGGRALGRVFDVIGPVARPFYCVRFNSAAHIKQAGIERDMDVYFAPRTEHTTFVFLEQLMKMKISDASWKDDEEPPPDFLEYSDDEEERMAKKERVIQKMVQRGAPVEQVEAKRAKMTENRSADGRGRGRGRGGRGRGDSADHRGGRGHFNGGHSGRNVEGNDGNMAYNAQRFDNGLYARSTNPFYRQSRHYDPRGQGSIQWGNYNLPPPPPQPSRGYFTAGYATAPGPQHHFAPPADFRAPPPSHAWSSFYPPPPPPPPQPP